MVRNFMGLEYETCPDIPDSIYDEVEMIILKETIKYFDVSIEIFKKSPDHGNAFEDIYGGLVTYADLVDTKKEAIEYLKKLEAK